MTAALKKIAHRCGVWADLRDSVPYVVLRRLEALSPIAQFVRIVGIHGIASFGRSSGIAGALQAADALRLLRHALELLA